MIELPRKRPLSTIPGVLADEVDVFICCASFEDRCLSIPGHIAAGSVRAAVVATNVVEPEVARNSATLVQHFGLRTLCAEVRLDDPIASADALALALDRAGVATSSSIVVDITTFTHEHLLILIGLLRARATVVPTLMYTGASNYMVGEEWLSRGISTIRSVLGFPGDIQPACDVHLVVLVGFELERVERLVDCYEPSIVSLGYSTRTESIAEAHAETNRMFHKRLSARLRNVHEFTFPCRSAVGTAGSIAEQVARFSGTSAVVAPLNTKVSTVGAALAALNNPGIQLCYAQAGEYNYAGYSRPSDTFYIVECRGLWKS